jgi:molybdenum cofactor cytidylyltransferase
VILAAGSSSRMGKPKALLNIGQTNFVSHICDSLNKSPFKPIWVVVGKSASEIQTQIQTTAKYNFIINPYPEKGQLFSLQLALDNIDEDSAGVLVVLVDHPLVDLRTYHLIYQKAVTHPDSIIIPVFNGKNGHPVYFGQRMFGNLKTAPLTKGARYTVEKNPHKVIRQVVNDNGVIMDIDTVNDYKKYVGSESNPTGKR